MQEKPWLKLPLELLQEKELSLSAKVIYVYMLWRYTFFVKERQGLYFESQETVASACGVSRKTVNESIHCSFGTDKEKSSYSTEAIGGFLI